MKKALLTMFFVVTFFAMSAVSAFAVVNDTILVGLRYGNSALFSANPAVRRRGLDGGDRHLHDRRR